MADASWPAGLPDWQIAPIRIEDAPNVVRTAMDVGPAKARRRSTVRRERVSFTLWLNGGELVTFRAFFRDELRDGALAFRWTRPDTEEEETYRFVSAPQWSMEIPASSTANRRYKASIELETVAS